MSWFEELGNTSGGLRKKVLPLKNLKTSCISYLGPVVGQYCPFFENFLKSIS
jgi:hypothetical protein